MNHTKHYTEGLREDWFMYQLLSNTDIIIPPAYVFPFLYLFFCSLFMEFTTKF